MILTYITGNKNHHVGIHQLLTNLTRIKMKFNKVEFSNGVKLKNNQRFEKIQQVGINIKHVSWENA